MTDKANKGRSLAGSRNPATWSGEAISRGGKAFHAANPGLLRGVRNPRAKLTEADVIEIKALYAEGGWRQKDLAVKFGVCQATIGRLLNGRTWQ